MKKFLLILLILISSGIQAISAPKKMIPTSPGDENQLPNIFIYTIPSDNETEIKDTLYIETPGENNNEAEITLFTNEIDDNITISATTLKGYAQYVEDSSILQKKDANNDYVLNIKEPQKISTGKKFEIKNNYKEKKAQQYYKNNEYLIVPQNIKALDRIGNFTYGATYGSEIDNIAMLEMETGLFTKYEKSRFALSSTFKKSLNTTFAQDYNTISVAPELRLNDYMSLKNVLSADITRRRNSSQLVFSLNPFGKKDIDRFLLELGAKHTTYEETGFTRTEFSFATKFKL